jgi:hypothetical protein
MAVKEIGAISHIRHFREGGHDGMRKLGASSFIADSPYLPSPNPRE